MFDLYEITRYKDNIEIIVHDHPKMKDVTVLRVFFTSKVLNSETPTLFKNFIFPNLTAKKILNKTRQRGIKIRPLGIKWLLKEVGELDPNQEKELLHVCCGLLN